MQKEAADFAETLVKICLAVRGQVAEDANLTNLRFLNEMFKYLLWIVKRHTDKQPSALRTVVPIFILLMFVSSRNEQ
jgi:hypothetical protein